MFTRKGKTKIPEDFPAACYGKLPAFGDFIRHNATSQEILIFDRWLQEGLFFSKSQMKETFDKFFTEAPSYYFFFRPDGKSRALLGLMVPSHDRSDRKYPFMVMLILNQELFLSHQMSHMPISFDSFFQQAEKLVLDAQAGLNASEIAGRTGHLSQPASLVRNPGPGVYQDFLTSTTTDTLVHYLFEGPAANDHFRLILQNLSDLLLPLRSQGSQWFTLGLKFPLSRDEKMNTCICSFWVEVCGKLSGGQPEAPLCFWTTTSLGTQPFLLLFFRQPTARIFISLLDLQHENEGVIDFTKPESLLPGAESDQPASVLQRWDHPGSGYLSDLIRDLG